MERTIHELALHEAMNFLSGVDLVGEWGLFRVGEYASVRVLVSPAGQPGQMRVVVGCHAFEPELVDWKCLRVIFGPKSSRRLDESGTAAVDVDSSTLRNLRTLYRIPPDVPLLDRRLVGKAAVPSPGDSPRPRLETAWAADAGGPRPPTAGWHDFLWVVGPVKFQISFMRRQELTQIVPFLTDPAHDGQTLLVRFVPSEPGMEVIQCEIPLTYESPPPWTLIDNVQAEIGGDTSGVCFGFWEGELLLDGEYTLEQEFLTK
jgi:hypothetical protein